MARMTKTERARAIGMLEAGVPQRINSMHKDESQNSCIFLH